MYEDVVVKTILALARDNKTLCRAHNTDIDRLPQLYGDTMQLLLLPLRLRRNWHLHYSRRHCSRQRVTARNVRSAYLHNIVYSLGLAEAADGNDYKLRNCRGDND